MLTIGVTGAGGGVGQAVLRALRLWENPPRIVAMDAAAKSAGLFWADVAHLVPHAHESQAFVDRMREIIEREAIDIIIPGLDHELMLLAQEKARIEACGCRVIVSDPRAVRLCRDKLAMSRYGALHGLPFVGSMSVSEAKERAETLDYPVILKPRGGSASAGIQFLWSTAELMLLDERLELIIQPYLPPRSSSTRPPVPGQRPPQSEEISAQYIIGKDGVILGTFVSENRLKDGVPVEIIPKAERHYHETGLLVAKAFAGLGCRGPLNLQGRMTPEGLRFFEANARFTGITAVRTAMGFREVEAVLHALAFDREEEARRCLAADLDQVGLRYVGEMLVPRRRIERLTAPRAGSEAPPHRVFVTGAAGYVGANLVARLLEERSVEVIAAVRSPEAATRLEASLPVARRLEIIEGELPDTGWCDDRVDIVVHAAAMLAGAEEGEILNVNVEGTRSLLGWARKAGVQRFVYLSSQAVYGMQPPPWREEQPARPATAYAYSKWIGELLCRQEVVPTVVLRVARLYGLGRQMRWAELPHKFAHAASGGEALPVHGSGRALLDLLHIKDLCEAVVRACRLPLSGQRHLLFNIGGGCPVSVRGIAELCINVSAARGVRGAQIEHQTAIESGSQSFGMSIGRAADILGWRPHVALHAGIDELMGVPQPYSEREPLLRRLP